MSTSRFEGADGIAPYSADAPPDTLVEADSPLPEAPAFPEISPAPPIQGYEPPTPLPVARRKDAPYGGVRWWEPVYVFTITLIVLALLTPRFLTFLNPATGDEPFYMMTATSLIKDHDLNECNNYRQRDEKALYPPSLVKNNVLPYGWQGWMAAPYPLPPHPALIEPAIRRCLGTNVKPLVRGIPGTNTPLPADGTESELYSKHGLGLSLMIAVPFALGGRLPVMLFLNLLGALLAANIYLFARQGTGSVSVGVLTWIAFAFTVPFMPYSFLIFPELPAALLVLYAFRRIWLGQNNLLQLLAVGSCIAFLPWLHYRFIPVSAALFAFFVYKLFKLKTRSWDDRLRELSPFIAPIIMSAIWLMAYFFFLYHHVYPNMNDHAGISDVWGTLRGMAGLFLDEQWGLFVYAPIYILAIVGVILMALRGGRRGDLLWIGIIFVPYFLVIANYAQWWGEWCPPSRYLTSVMPLLALPFAVVLDRIRGPLFKTIYGVLLLLSLFIMAAFVYQPQWMYNQPNGESELLSKGGAQLVLQLPEETISRLPENLQPLPDEKTGKPVLKSFGALPTFVVPYFSYLLQDKDSGDYWAAQAWQHSIWPFALIFAIVGVSLLLAWLQARRGRPYGGTGGSALELSPY